ncbi:unnamed protein product, partial [Iphiclides podalirius]
MEDDSLHYPAGCSTINTRRGGSRRNIPRAVNYRENDTDRQRRFMMSSQPGSGRGKASTQSKHRWLPENSRIREGFNAPVKLKTNYQLQEENVYDRRNKQNKQKKIGFKILEELAKSESTLRTCRPLIEITTQECLKRLSEQTEFELSDEYKSKLSEVRSILTHHEKDDQEKPKTSKHVLEADDSEPPQNFRELSVIPTCEDLLERRPFLRPNIVDGAYHNLEHYLDVQFRLLREDCYGPIREGIHQFIAQPSRQKYDHVRLFRNVIFIEPYVSELKSGYLIQLHHTVIKRFKMIKWAHSKRFIYGSLILLTKDNCKSFIMATVLDHNPKYLAQGKIPVSLVDNSIGMDICFTRERYTMIESEVYFEPYYHVLHALKDPEFPKHLTMSKYIVSVDPEPKLPCYLQPDDRYEIICEDFIDASFQVADANTWPTNEQLGLNESQYEAFKLALTHEFAVIQGPPDSIARIGSQSRSETMEQYNIYNLRKRYRADYLGGRNLFYDEKSNLKRIHTYLKSFQERLYSLPNQVLSYECVSRYFAEIKALLRFYGRDDEDPLHQWLFENMDCNVELSNLDDDQEDFVIDEEDSRNKRNDVLWDCFDDDVTNVNFSSDLENLQVTFSLKDAIAEIKTLTAKYGKAKNEEELRYIHSKMYILNGKINLFREMSVNRRRDHNVQLNIRNPKQMTTLDRWVLYFTWSDFIVAELMKNVVHIQESFVKAATDYEESRMIMDQEVLKNVKVIGMTTTAAARQRKLITSLAPPIVIVEEAAEVLEQHIITSLTRNTRHLILIGDHQQLRPSAAHMKLAKHYNIEVSLFERMVMNKIHSRRLGVQHRMRPEIAALISPHIYTDLANHPSVKDFPDVRGMTSNLFFFSHDYKEEVIDESSSKSNQKEADMVLGLANYLIQQDYAPGDVTILSAYSGQMFYMRKERSKYAHLRNVKITVVDNYQGEESKIILLSLVRNNDQDKIGFLGTENRICVALSRAREGFYMFGNIDILRKNSELWEKIACTLEEGRSLGKSLKLRCERHLEEITISNAADFDKSPEGGCLKKCSSNLSCGHQCPLICHGYDRGHVVTKCIQKCERVLCEIGHVCPLMCAVPCEPCIKPVEKTLKCGHAMSLPCSLDITDPSVKCITKVSVVLPNCNHEVHKVCYLDTMYVVCPRPCIYRVESCGHECVRSCHVTLDPRHEKYVCPKPCAKAKQGCTANLLGDRGDHQCTKKCHETCDPCTVEVNKKRSSCKHSERVPCNVDVDVTSCKKKCSRSLPCGHFCKNKCSEPCGNCTQKVNKTIPDCGHTIKVECKALANRELCTSKCERTLPCGHPCDRMCKDPCKQTNCTVKVDKDFNSPCGHKVRLPCNVYHFILNDSTAQDIYLRYCEEPCKETLMCGHRCQGTCSKCFQGRIHAPCKQTCHQTNICGHQCQEPCNQVCPPCKLPCEVKCAHSQCNKLCGDVCPPCQEPCSRSCAHGECSRRCGEPCSRAPCDAPCPRALPCGHGCRGLCGEPCPDVCRACRPDHFPKDFLGDEFDDDARFIKLQDCTHVMELENMDTFMMADKETIAIRTCPFCRKPIINTSRYKDLVNNTFAMEINPVKERVYGTKEKIEIKKKELLEKLDHLGNEFRITFRDSAEGIRYLKSILAKVKCKVNLSLLSLEMLSIHLEILEMIFHIHQKYEPSNTNELKNEIKEQMTTIFIYSNANINKISQQQQKDIGNEIKRIHSTVQLSKILSHAAYMLAKTHPNVNQALAGAKQSILGWCVFNEQKAVKSLDVLQEAVKLSGIVTKQERDLIVKAIGLKAGHWYKCPNGHIYCIGECGGAMQVSKCIECGAAIGGQSHTLLRDNAHAPEMDGSSFPAWSEQYNNMANFHLD